MASTIAAVSSRPSVPTSAMTTSAPAWVKVRAAWRPMPPAAPVMTAVRPLSENCWASSSERSGRSSGPAAPWGSPLAARFRMPEIMSMV